MRGDSPAPCNSGHIERNDVDAALEARILLAAQTSSFECEVEIMN